MYYGVGFLKVYSYGIRSGAVRISNLLASYGKYSFAGRQGILDNVFCVFYHLIYDSILQFAMKSKL